MFQPKRPFREFVLLGVVVLLSRMHLHAAEPLDVAETVDVAKPVDVAKRPNVIVILADDLGYADLSAYGGKISTPHIDSLANQGVRFTDAHSSSSVCSPTRYGLVTGRYNWRSPLKQGVLGGLSPRLIEPNRTTIASFLKGCGYHTACVGKWHLGMNWELKPGKKVTLFGIEPREQVFNVHYDRPVIGGPNAVGFDYFFGISASLDMVPYTYIENERVTALPTEDRDFPMMLDRQSGGRTRKGPTAPDFDAADVLPTLAQKAVKYIEDRAPGAAAKAEHTPFFLYVPLASPHTPILPTTAWQGKSEINSYGDFVMETDWAVGEILAALQRTGLSNDTIVIFTSDNGCSPQAQFDELAKHGHFPSGPLRGHKADLFEGGHRVPFLVRWPGQAVVGAVSPQLVCLTDIFATVADIINESLPDNAAEDSFSFLPALQENSAAVGVRDHLVSHSINGSFAIRRGDWKLLLCRDSGGWSEPRPNTPAAATLPNWQLYDLANDLGERHNRIDENPDQAAELRGLLQRLVQEGRSTPGQPQSNTGPVNLRDTPTGK